MFYRLPPVGNPVCLTPSTQDALTVRCFHGWAVDYYASGTAALAAALLAARRYKASVPARKAEVILPAYACPDLLAAAHYAGLQPVLVDLAPERPWMDLERLAAAIGHHTVAVIAVDLFGVKERLAAIRALTEAADIVLVEDSAQAFPGRQAAEEGRYWQGDLVVLSFGRGKPVSLLGGGAVLSRVDGLAPEPILGGEAAGVNRPASLADILKARVYNRLVSPRLYWLPDSLPFLHLGETRYHALRGIEAMDAWRRGLLEANIEAYFALDTHAARLVQRLRSLLAETPGVIDLPAVCGLPLSHRLLRYPLLAPETRRDVWYGRLQRAGLGASTLYPASLPHIPGVPPLPQGHYPQADAFARRILTLPLHAGVRLENIARMHRCLL